jgi:uncharacterized RDD family membrane protein YckC
MEYTMSPVGAVPTTMVEGAAVRYAGFWRRFVAWVLDWLIIGAVFSVPMFMFGIGMWSDSYTLRTTHGWNYNTYGDHTGFAGAMMSMWLVYFVGAWLYHALMESSKQQGTLGKMALGLRVTDLEGRRINFGRATGRYFAKILSTLIFMIGYIMAAFTSKKQALHDFIGGTLVLSKQSTVPAQVAQNAFAGT